MRRMAAERSRNMAFQLGELAGFEARVWKEECKACGRPSDKPGVCGACQGGMDLPAEWSADASTEKA